MREKRNAVRAKLAEKEQELDKLSTDHKKVVETEANLRQRLQLAEQNVILLNSELMDLKEQATELKAVKLKMAKMQQQLLNLQSNDTAPLIKKVEALETALSEKDDHIKAANRKLDRLRRRDPLLQLSAQVSALTRGTESASATPQSSSLAEDAFAILQDDFSTAVQSAWVGSASRNGNAAKYIAAAAKEFLLKSLPHAHLDASVTVDGDVDEAAAIFSSAGFQVARQPNTAPVGLVVSSDVASSCGPFALAAALYEITAANPVTPRQYGFTLRSAHPCVTPSLMNNKARSRVEMDTARSSKPGGQASNVSETQITLRLFVDNVFCFSSEAQDTRSALSNKELALERLRTERMPQYNLELSRGKHWQKVQQTALETFLHADDGVASITSLLQHVEEAASGKLVPASDVVIMRSIASLRSLASGGGAAVPPQG